jgi:hypothetical protein
VILKPAPPHHFASLAYPLAPAYTLNACLFPRELERAPACISLIGYT